MSEENQAESLITGLDELSLLKQRATVLGIVFSNNIGLATLKEKVDAHLAQLEATVTAPALTDPQLPANTPKKRTLRQIMLEEQMKLVRVNISNLDPKKKDLPGEVFTVANEYLGTVRKYIPYGADGKSYHIPMCLYNLLKDKEFLYIRVNNKPGAKNAGVSHEYTKEFSLEVLPPLTEEELKKLALAQAASNAID